MRSALTTESRSRSPWMLTRSSGCTTPTSSSSICGGKLICVPSLSSNPSTSPWGFIRYCRTVPSAAELVPRNPSMAGLCSGDRSGRGSGSGRTGCEAAGSDANVAAPTMASVRSVVLCVGSFMGNLLGVVMILTEVRSADAVPLDSVGILSNVRGVVKGKFGIVARDDSSCLDSGLSDAFSRARSTHHARSVFVPIVVQRNVRIDGGDVVLPSDRK